MASVLKVDTITGVTTAGSIAVTGEGNSTTTNLQQGLCKVFVVYGEDTVIDAGSFNIASLTDSGTGNTTHNFTNNFAGSENYTVAISSIPGTDVAERPRLSNVSTSFTNTVNEEVDTSTDRDADQFHYSAHGDLA
jgi:hypothetical protein|tara:strand:+ start:380 stop:784 length:405 start_codon:yes stop_codon:yes gene_type:complete